MEEALSRGKKPILLKAVEYLSQRSGGELHKKGPALYVGIRARSSDGQLCLVVRSPHARRNFNIAMASVHAVTTRNGRRHQIEVPADNPRLRAEEVRWIVEKTRAAWAAEALDPNSPRYFKNGPTFGHISSPEIEPIGPPGKRTGRRKPGLFAALDRLVQSVLHRTDAR